MHESLALEKLYYLMFAERNYGTPQEFISEMVRTAAQAGICELHSQPLKMSLCRSEMRCCCNSYVAGDVSPFSCKSLALLS